MGYRAIESGLVSFYVRDVLSDKPFLNNKKGLAIGGGVSPQSPRPLSVRASGIQKISKNS